MDVARLSTRPVILYDQFGSGRSTHLPDTIGNETIWTFDLFISELDNLIKTLGIKSYDLVGQSAGGMLAAQWATLDVDGPVSSRKGLNKLIIASAPARIADWNTAGLRLVKAMGPNVSEPILAASESGDYSGEAYEAAVDAYMAEHFYRNWPPTGGLALSFDSIGQDPTVYATMNGPNEIEVVGSMRGKHLCNKSCCASHAYRPSKSS